MAKMVIVATPWGVHDWGWTMPKKKALSITYTQSPGPIHAVSAERQRDARLDVEHLPAPDKLHRYVAECIARGNPYDGEEATIDEAMLARAVIEHFPAVVRTLALEGLKGDASAIGPIGDWLEEHGYKSRADCVRGVMTWRIPRVAAMNLTPAKWELEKVEIALRCTLAELAIVRPCLCETVPCPHDEFGRTYPKPPDVVIRDDFRATNECRIDGALVLSGCTIDTRIVPRETDSYVFQESIRAPGMIGHRAASYPRTPDGTVEVNATIWGTPDAFVPTATARRIAMGDGRHTVDCGGYRIFEAAVTVEHSLSGDRVTMHVNGLMREDDAQREYRYQEPHGPHGRGGRW